MVSMIPFGLLAGFVGEREVRLTEIDESGFCFRTIEENISDSEALKVCFYDIKNGCYRELEIPEYDIQRFDMVDAELSGFYVKYNVTVKQKAYAEAVQRLLYQYNHYIHLKLEEDDSALAKSLTGYPGELDEVKRGSLEEQANNLPENWVVYQCIATADGTTALTYARDNSMRSLLLDKIARSELIVFNRAEAVNNDAARQELHKLVRQASRKCDIAYEFADGSVAYDDIPDPLPFDLNAPIVEIGEDDFGIWYMDCQDEPQKYTGKTVRFLAQVCQTNRAGKNSFVPGRFAMTCCVQDIQFVGFPCSYDGYKALEQRAWVTVTAKVNYKFHNIYRGKGPVLTAISVEPAEKPQNDVVTFS